MYLRRVFHTSFKPKYKRQKSTPLSYKTYLFKRLRYIFLTSKTEENLYMRNEISYFYQCLYVYFFWNFS